MDIQLQEAQRVPKKMISKISTPRHTIIKMAKVKERILKATRKKQLVTYKRTPIRRSADFSAETLQARGEWHDISKLSEIKYKEKIFIAARENQK